jgi:phosphatidylinositol glycan class B
MGDARSPRGPLNFLRANSALLVLMTFALALRVASIFAFPSLHHPDELYQSLEQGHRLAFGYGVVPWEFEEGIRSYVIPVMMAAVMRIAAVFSDDPDVYLGACRVALAVLSVVPVVSIYRLGRERSLAAAVLGSLAFATSFEAVYFSGRALSEAVSAVFLICAVAEASRSGSDHRRQIMFGFLIASSFFLRVQFAPALALIALHVLGKDAANFRQSASVAGNLLLGAVPPLLLFGVCDMIFWGAPFVSYYNYVVSNFVQGKASAFGSEPASWYLLFLNLMWGRALTVLAVLALLGTRTYPLFLRCALAILLFHALIPHKEYRFVFVVDVLLLIAASLYAAQFLDAAVKDRRGRNYAAGIAGIALCWMAASCWLAFEGPFATMWRSADSLLAFEKSLRSSPALCGLFVRGVPWWQVGSYAYLHRNAPMFFDEFEGAPPKAAYNYEIASYTARPQIDPDYAVVSCVRGNEGADLCLWRREGSCLPSGGPKPILAQRRIGAPP